MPLSKLERIRAEHPTLSGLIDKMADYVRDRASARADVVPKLAAVKLGIPEAAALGILHLFDKAGLVRPRYDIICPRTNATIGSAHSKDELEAVYECGYCGGEHAVSDAEIELIFEPDMQMGGSSEVAA